MAKSKLSDQELALRVQFVRPANPKLAEKAFMKDQAKRYGADVLGYASRPKLRIKSSSLKFNRILGGGWLRGRLYEMFGPESGGKTTWGLDCLGNAQKQYPDLNVLVVDAEASLDLDRAAMLGVDVKRMPKPIIPPNGDVGLQMVVDACMSGAFSAIMVDSVAALTPSEEVIVDVGKAKNKVGLSGKMMSQGLRKIVFAAYVSDTAVIFINQVRDKPGVMFGPTEQTPGGRALKFYASARIEVRSLSGEGCVFLDSNKERIGQKTQMHVVKNKLGAPYRKSEIDLYYTKPLDAVSELIEIGEKTGIITTNGRKKIFRDHEIAASFDEMVALFIGNHEWRDALTEDVEKTYVVESGIQQEKENEIKELLSQETGIEDMKEILPETEIAKETDEDFTTEGIL